MVVIFASRIFSIDHTQNIFTHFFGRTAHHIALTLLGNNVFNQPLARGKIVFQLPAFIFTAFVFKYRLFNQFVGRIANPGGKNDVAVSVHLNKTGIQIHVAIFHRSRSVHSGDAVVQNHQRIHRSIIDHHRDGFTLFLRIG